MLWMMTYCATEDTGRAQHVHAGNTKLGACTCSGQNASLFHTLCALLVASIGACGVRIRNIEVKVMC
jgi:hypothetical protein